MIRRARLRLALAYAGTFVLILLVLGAAAYWSLRRSLAEEVDRSVETVVSGWLSTQPSLATLRPLDLERDYDERADVFLLVFRSDGALLANPNRVEAEEFLEEGLVRRGLGGETWDTIREHGDRLRVLTAPVVEGGVVTGVVIGGRNLEAHDRQLQALAVALGVGGVVGVLLAGVGGWLFAGRALRPIAEAYERQRAFVGDASHELRSPLAVIRASSELLLREPLPDGQRDAVQEVLDTSVEASTLVEDLLTIARLDRAEEPRPDEQTDVAPTVADVVRQLRPLLEAHGTTVEERVPALAVRFGSADLRRVLRALLENVLAHTPPGTGVTVDAALHGREVTLAVRDDGPGVPERALPTLFDPFTRVERARTPGHGHSGLGLAIAARLVRRNGGRIEARNRPEGGLEVLVRCQRA